MSNKPTYPMVRKVEFLCLADLIQDCHVRSVFARQCGASHDERLLDALLNHVVDQLDVRASVKSMFKLRFQMDTNAYLAAFRSGQIVCNNPSVTYNRQIAHDLTTEWLESMGTTRAQLSQRFESKPTTPT
jgi:hypothetical protein